MAHHNEHEEHCHSHGCSCCCEQGHDHHDEEEMNWWKPALSLTMLVAGIIMGPLQALAPLPSANILRLSP